MSDLLSAASLLLTVLAIFFGLWYPEMAKVIDTPNYATPANHRKEHESFTSIYQAKAIPLTVAACLLTCIFAPDACKIVYSSLRHFCEVGISGVLDYSAVSTSLVLVTLLFGFIARYLLRLTSKMRDWLKHNEPPAVTQ
ncbi:MAG TPA: hypothetical protein VF703_19780 [Pyrinomonadaceae bacterium]|jgi:hypothetical protein